MPDRSNRCYLASSPFAVVRGHHHRVSGSSGDHEDLLGWEELWSPYLGVTGATLPALLQEDKSWWCLGEMHM